jgi:hypothetical protein
MTACGEAASAADTEYIYGQIDSISGNDIVLSLAEYHEAETGATAVSSDEKTTEPRSRSSRSESGEKPEGFDPSSFSGKMPEGFDASQFEGKMPDRSSKSGSSESGTSQSSSEKREKPEGFDSSKFSGNMPEGFDASQFEGKMPSRGSQSDSGETSEGASRSSSEKPEGFDTSKYSSMRSGSSKYTLTGEQEEMRIPVGTTVTTLLGVETDFEVLKTGDYIKCSAAKDSSGNAVITAVQIVEQ